MSDAFQRGLDQLIAQARADFGAQDQALCSIANALARYAQASDEIVRIGQMIDGNRQPMPPPAAPPHPLRAQTPEEAWQEIRQQALAEQG